MGLVFDIEKSEVVKWILAQPGMKQWLFDRLTHGGGIVYDKTTGCWRGINHNPWALTPTQSAQAAKDLTF